MVSKTDTNISLRKFNLPFQPAIMSLSLISLLTSSSNTGIPRFRGKWRPLFRSLSGCSPADQKAWILCVRDSATTQQLHLYDWGRAESQSISTWFKSLSHGTPFLLPRQNRKSNFQWNLFWGTYKSESSHTLCNVIKSVLIDHSFHNLAWFRDPRDVIALDENNHKTSHKEKERKKRKIF